MAGDNRDHADKTLLSFTKKVAVTDEIVTNNHQNVSGSGTKWYQNCSENYISHMLTDPYSYLQNTAEGSWREILRLYKKKRVQKGVPKRLFPYLMNW